MNGQLSVAIHKLSGFGDSKHRTTFRRCCFGFLFGGLLLLAFHLYDDAIFGISDAALLVAVLDTFDFEVFLFDILFFYFFLDCLSDFVL